ncbi:glycoside hydrolase family 15 protein [Hydrogenophilus thermoluteolus]|uniref:glycoside hydrolase family 15 protein n=1 Tax=Hydrogenophilus thermoluteolus TaxID=297 RepID=UPI003F676625
MRLTTNAPITAVAEELPFFLNDRIVLLLGPDESLQDDLRETANRFYHNTVEYWRDWVRHLAIPFEWQEAVIRAAIALKLNEFEDTGAIIAAMTTSIPEAPNTVRNWDYRYCWLRDAYFVLNTLNRLGQTTTLEHYLGYLLSVTANAHHHELQPVYGIDGRADLTERTFDTLSGYRGMGPVRVGNQAFVQRQNDVYGAAILAVAHAFSTSACGVAVTLHSSNNSNRWVSAPWRSTTSPMPDFGNYATISACTPFRRSCVGRRVTVWRTSLPVWGEPNGPPIGTTTPLPSKT